MTAKQLHLLRYICGYQEAHGGVSPSFREIAVGIGLSPKSLATVSFQVYELEWYGYIHKFGPKDNRARSRAIEVLRPVPVPHAPDGAALWVVPLAIGCDLG